MGWLWVFALTLLLSLNAVASVRVLGSSATSAAQRTIQLLLIWLVPIVGAVVCLAFVAVDTIDERPSLDRSAFIDNADAGGTPWDAPPGANIGGCSGSARGDGADGAAIDGSRAVA